MLRRIVKMHFKEEHHNDFEKLFEEIRMKISEQPGCHFVQLMRGTDDSGTYFTFSEWRDEESLNAYKQTDLFGAVWPQVKSWMSDKPQAWSTEIIDPER